MIKFSVIENAQRRINKMDVDGSAPETVMISAMHRPRIRPDGAAPVISELCQRIQDEKHAPTPAISPHTSLCQPQ